MPTGVAGLSNGHPPRLRRRQAAQLGQKRDGGVKPLLSQIARLMPCPLISFAACACVMLAALGCTGEPTVETVPGPEATGLLNNSKGYIVTDDSGDISAISLPDRKPHVVRHLSSAADGSRPTIHALSGPDRDGRIVYVEDYFFVKHESQERHLLKSINVDGKNDTELFSRPGSAMWATSAAGNGEIGHYLALSPTNGHVAFISHVKNRQMPRALLSVGRLEFWNLNGNTGPETKITALDEPMSWFPDGQRLAYAALVPRKALPQDADGLEAFGNYCGEVWEEIPAIYIYDLTSGKSEFFHVGWQPVVSYDGKTVFVGGWGGNNFSWHRVNVKTGESTHFVLPGGAGPILGTTPDNFVLYVGLPTAGSPIRFTDNNSPLRGPKQMLTIKVTNEKGKKFQTIVPYLDPRSHASFGPAPQ